MTLTEFLLARIAEDEAEAHAAVSFREPRWVANEGAVITFHGEHLWAGETVVYDEGRPNEAQAEHIARWDPARVLAECEAKRDAIELAWSDHLQIEGGTGRGQKELEAANDYPSVVSALAKVFADHPDFDQSWAI